MKAAGRFFNWLSSAVARATASTYGFMLAFSMVLLGVTTGAMFEFSTSWKLLVNTATTIITFLMVFVIQQAQNKNTVAIQLKLNELIASNSRASNLLVDIEELTPEELAVVKKFYVKLAKQAETATDGRASRSLDEVNPSRETERSDGPR